MVISHMISKQFNLIYNLFQWVGPIEDFEAEFDSIDANGGGQILFNEFVDWATEKNLDIEDDEDQLTYDCPSRIYVQCI